MVTRFRVGTNRPIESLNLHVSLVSPLPKSYRDAFSDPNWQNAMCDEYHVLIKNKTWTLVPRPPDTNIVRCMWHFCHKYLADGTLSRYKARLVANGNTQLEGVEVDETFSSVVKPGTIRTVRSLATSRHWPIYQIDVKNAFLHGDSETVYMHQPPNYGTDTAYLLLYVDDIVHTASSDGLLQRIISSLHQEFAMTDLGALYYFLESTYDNCETSRTLVDTKTKLGVDGDPVSDPTFDNRSLAVSVYQRTKHIEIDIHFVRDLVAARQVRVLHVPSRYQFADIFTKGLSSALFEEFRSSLSVRCPPAQTAGEC
ncbi:ribonuclease H-like domain-containing protein [Tanacetum coccineum]